MDDVNRSPWSTAPTARSCSGNGRLDSLWALNVVVAESTTTMNGNRLRPAHRIFDIYRGPTRRCSGDSAPAIGGDHSFPLSGKPKPEERDRSRASGATACQAIGRTGESKAMVTRILVNWAKAIAAYEYRLISVDSPFDQFVAEGAARSHIGAAKRGARLFVGKAACIDCHNGPQLTDEQFHNVGVPQTGVTVRARRARTERRMRLRRRQPGGAPHGARAKGCGA